MNTMLLKKIPIADLNSKFKLTNYIDRILSEKKLNHLADTTNLEAEIDARVAHLYNLAEEEYSLILKEINCRDPFRVAALNLYRDIAKKRREGNS